MNLQITPATAADAEVLAELGASTFYDTFHTFHSEEDMQLYLDKAYRAEDIALKLTDPQIAYFICRDGDDPVGYTKLLLNATHPGLSGRCIELEKIYVRRDYLGHQVGKLLMDHAIAFSKDQAFDQLFLGVWQENHRAVNFYRKAGFDVFATRTFQLGKTLCDDYLMCLSLR